MSFYGKVLYEFRKLFSHFKFENYSNSNDGSPDFPSQVKDGTIEANDNWDTLKFKMGNRWLGLVAEDTDEDTTKDNTEKEDGVTLYHMGPGDADSTKGLESIKYIPNVEVEGASQLMPGEHFEIWTTDFDAAGHNTETTSKGQVLRLPALEINNIGTNDKIKNTVNQKNNVINLKDDAYIKGSISQEEDINILLEHIENENPDVVDCRHPLFGWAGVEGLDFEGKHEIDNWTDQGLKDYENSGLISIWQLQAGGLIRVPCIQYDGAGHAKFFENQYFRLPSYQDEEGNDIIKRLLAAEESIIKINDKLSGIESENIIETLGSQGNRISTLEDNMSNYLLISKYEEEIGEVNSLFEGYSFYDKAPTLVNLIGDQEKASREIDRLLKYLNSEYDDVTPGTNKQIYSINENVSAIADAIIRIGGYEDMKHSNLVSRIKALEDKIL